MQNVLTLPPLLAVTLVTQVVWCVCADGLIGTGIRGTRGEDFSTSGSTVRKLTPTGETCHTVHTSALVQTGTGCTLIDVHLAEVTCQNYRRDIKTFFQKPTLMNLRLGLTLENVSAHLLYTTRGR